jgi:transposase
VQQESRSGDVVMLGLPGFAVLSVDEIDGELEVAVETIAVRVGCPRCGVIAALHDRRETVVRDVDAFDRPVRLRWRKRVWRCREPLCAQVTWTEQRDAIASRAVLTERARRRACRRVGKDGQSVAAVARDLGVGWHTVMRSVWRHGRPLVDDPARLEGVTALGMDETAFLRGNRHHHTTYVSGLVDTATGRLLDVVEDRTATAVMGWLSRRDRRWLARICVVALDPHRGYANAVGAHLGHATLVVDHFHIIQLANRVVDDVRRRVQREHTGHRGRKRDPLYGARKLLLKACGDLDTRGWIRLGAALRAGDPDGEVAAAWQLKEIARDLYRADGIDEARDVLKLLYAWADSGHVPEMRRFAGTVRRWESQVLAYFTTGGASNGPTEAVNLTIKQIKRAGRGFTNFDNYRLRLLLHCGGCAWQDQPAARLRSRSPRLVA